MLEHHPVTVRAAVHPFEAGIAGLVDALRPGRPARLLGAKYRAALGELLDDSARAGINWTVPALCEWLRDERGVTISADSLGELLRREGFRWKRTRDSVRHKADSVLQQAARAQLEVLRSCGRPRSGRTRSDLPGRVRVRSHHAHRLHLVQDRAACCGAEGGNP
ncbi:winged helix-turn-helix domain-containing protein [Streptomyces sp. NBC_00237]|uniref:winged helix-turn-helix domain-containing protein n=1 Tax=Streptomyces sp. NBC_00237 TaxID=2975687 RepID=UPI00338F2898